MCSYKRQFSSILNMRNVAFWRNFQCQRKNLVFWFGRSREGEFGRFERVEPMGVVSRDPSPPPHCSQPPYARGGVCNVPSVPERKSAADVQSMRRACRLARQMLDHLRPLARVGVTTEELNNELWREVVKAKGYPSPLGYHDFPRSVCTSVNDVAVHGIPDARPLLDGDIISVDVSVYLDGFHGDCADTFLVGNVDEKGRDLVKAAYNCLKAGISVCKPGVPFAAIGKAIDDTAEASKVCVVGAFLGHGIGSYFHGPPDIHHVPNVYPGCMEAGMTFTIEPVVAQGEEDVLLLKDGWTAVMEDGGRAAQAEQTLLITEDGYDILTQ